MTGIDWIIIGLYCLGLLAVGAIFARSNKNASDMFVAGRSSPWWLSGISAYMTMFTAGTFVVWGGLTYEYGLVGAVICSMYGIAAFLAGRFFAGKWRETNLSTPAEFVTVRFSKKAFNFHTAYRGAYLAMSGLALYAVAVMLCPLMPLGALLWPSSWSSSGQPTTTTTHPRSRDRHRRRLHHDRGALGCSDDRYAPVCRAQPVRRACGADDYHSGGRV